MIGSAHRFWRAANWVLLKLATQRSKGVPLGVKVARIPDKSSFSQEGKADSSHLSTTCPVQKTGPMNEAMWHVMAMSGMLWELVQMPERAR